MFNCTTETASGSEAVFVGWQETRSGNVIALYNVVVRDHPSYGSTVTAKTLHELGLKVPNSPPIR